MIFEALGEISMLRWTLKEKTGTLNICSGKSSETPAEKGLFVPITTLFRDKQWTQKYAYKPYISLILRFLEMYVVMTFPPFEEELRKKEKTVNFLKPVFPYTFSHFSRCVSF